MHDSLRAPRASARFLGIIAACLLSAAPSLADDFSDRINAPYKQIAADHRSDLLLLPLIAKMAPPPRAITTLESAILLPPGKAGWSEALAWASAQPQKDVLAALASVTKEPDWRKAFAFGQPYGIDGVDPALVQSSLYTDLGDPPTLAGAKFLYMQGLDKLALLVQVEATRLTAEGKVSDAIDLLTNWIFFARQMCDRQFYTEASWGLKQMAVGQERIRDVAYTDSISTKKLDVARLKEQIKRLQEDAQYLDLGRMKFPAGNRASADQLVARLYKRDGSPDERAFADTMSRLSASRHPLRLFSESGKWRSIAGNQGRGDAAADQANAIFSDWAGRWNISSRIDNKGVLDQRLGVPTAYSKLDKDRFAAVSSATPDMTSLMDLRDLTRVEGVGTRSALGLIGYANSNRNFPPQLSAIRPAWMIDLGDDLFNPTARNRGGKPTLSYFVPIRDTADFDGPGVPHEIEVFVPNANFKVNLKDDVFVLYSWGSDLAKNNAKRVQNVAERVEGADYLMWPPVISLFRQHMLDAGDFK